jgi:hypothetical protein
MASRSRNSQHGAGVVRKGLDDLLRRPYGGGMFRDWQVNDSAAVVAE